ncbi:MAG TPA: CPBP family intramembrane glutamic endopeptidase, partial [Humisphaera sp.]
APSAWPPPPPPRRLERYHFGPLGPSAGRTGPFIEAFAVFLLIFVALPFGLRYAFNPAEFGIFTRLGIMFGALGLGLLWPRFRGVPWAEWRRGFGWTAPRGVFRELAAGLVGYLAGLPLLALATLVMFVLNKVSGAEPSHPINDEFGTGGTLGVVLIYAAAAVWAPVVEETFFRGALFHRLRGGWNWLVSAAVSSFAFAAVHPQGWTVIPVLMAIAVVFCTLREWRGSSLPGMAGHALHNGLLVTMMVIGGT